jgi:uncharacterized protein (DUF433 family)
MLETPFKNDLEHPLSCAIREAGGGKKMKLDRITIDPARMNGQPCIRNMRLTVRRVVELAATYPDREELREEYPELEDEDIRQALLYAATYLDDRVVDLPTSHETTP